MLLCLLAFQQVQLPASQDHHNRCLPPTHAPLPFLPTWQGRGAEGDTAAAVQQLLLESVAPQQPEPARMAALQWALKLFPFDHVPARYLCMLAAADSRFQVAEAALEGLQPGKFAGGGMSTNGGKDAAPQFPVFGDVLQFLLAQAPQLRRRPADGAGLPLPPKV